MKRFAVILSVVIVSAAVVVLCFIGIIEYQTNRSEREVQRLVSRFSPSTQFSNVVQQLGRPTNTYTNTADVQMFGIIKDPTFVNTCALHTFVHRGPPARWILIYTDHASQKVVFAAWTHM